MPARFSLFIYWNTNFKIEKLTTSYIDLSVCLILKNKAPLDLLIQSLKVDVYLNNRYVTQVYTNAMKLAANSEGKIKANIRLNLSEVGSALFESFLSNNYRNAVIRFDGRLDINNKWYKFNISMLLGEILG